MLQSHTQNSFHSITSLGDQLCDQLNDIDITDLQTKVSEYNQKIEKYFRLQTTKDFTEVEEDALQELMLTHKRVTELFNKKKEKILKNIKNLHAGKKMKNTYS